MGKNPPKRIDICLFITESSSCAPKKKKKPNKKPRHQKSGLVQQKIKIKSPPKKWSTKKFCHLAVTFGNNNRKACVDGHFTRPAGMLRTKHGSQQMSLGRSWKKNSRQGRRSRSPPREVSFTRSLYKKLHEKILYLNLTEMQIKTTTDVSPHSDQTGLCRKAYER